VGTTTPQSLLSVAGTAEFGSGDSGTPVAETIRGAAAAGSNIAGANLTVDASNGTGGGGSGALILRTANPSGGASPVFDSASAAQHGNMTNPFTWTHTVANQPNRILLVTVSYNAQTATITSSSVTYGGQALTRVTSDVNCSASNNCQSEMWYLKNPPVGTNTVSIVPSAAGQAIVAGSSSYYNVDQTNTFGTITTNTGTSAGFAQAATTTANQMVVDGFSGVGAGSYAIGGTGTLNYVDTTNHGGGSSHQVASGASTTFTWTNGSTDPWAEIIAPLNAPTNSEADTLVDRLHITASGNIGINNANPTTSLDIVGNASESGNFTFTGITAGAAAKVDLLNNTSLGFYNSVGGDAGLGANPALFIAGRGNNGSIGVGTSNPLAALDVRGNSGTTPIASFSAKTSFAGLVVDNSGTGDLFTASSSGLNRFVITQAGNVGYWDNVPREAAAQ